MNNHKFLGRILTPSVQGVEELFTTDFLTVNDCTSLRCDHHPRITTVEQLRTEQRFLNKVDDLFGRTCSNQDFVERVAVNGVQQILTIRLFEITLRQLLNHNLRWQDVTLVNQFGCRNIANHLPIDSTIIHSWFEDGKRMLRSSSKKVATISIVREELSSREEVAFDGIVCFVEVNCID